MSSRMFNWVVKVVPQPPEAPGSDEAAKTPAAPAVRQHLHKDTHHKHTVCFSFS